jgi:hypothetical protein
MNKSRPNCPHTNQIQHALNSNDATKSQAK